MSAHHENAPAGMDPDKTLLRFITCGSVDDGKSSLIGRLLYDSKLIFDDHMAAITKASRKHGTLGEEVDLALLVDGLEAEREQGITIDVAYRFFTTKARSFIVADTPGHEQFTRNMATGASTADVAIILVDARKGVLVQTKRHSTICSLLGIRHVVLAVNKIDLVDDAGETFHRIVADYLSFAKALGFASIAPIPVSARFGDNVSVKSARTPWYDGPTLLSYLENVEVEGPVLSAPFRFPVQWVNRPNLDFRGFSGTVASGQIHVGETLQVASSGRTSTVTRIVTFDGDLPEAHAGQSVTLCLADEIDIARGDLLARPDETPEVVDQFQAKIVWMSEDEMLPGRSYLLFTGTRMVPARVSSLRHRIDVNTLGDAPAQTLKLNDIGVCNIASSAPVAFDPYRDNRRTGAFVLIDRQTNATAAAGMIEYGLRRASNVFRQGHAIDRTARALAKQQRPMILWFTGLSGSGKSTIADRVEKELHARGFHTMLLDGDNIRHGLNRDLGFTGADRVENIRRVGETAKLMTDAGLIVLCCFISPFEAERRTVRELVAEGEFLEIFVDAPLEECIRRDVKGLYRKAMDGKIPNFTGINSPYEVPSDPDVRIDAMTETPEEAARRIIGIFTARQSQALE
jgi:bifunctional enzyme CysN/CysC